MRAEKRKADEVALELTKALEAERARSKQFETQSHSGDDKSAEAEKARMASEETMASLREELKRERLALEAAIEAKRVSEEKLAVLAAAASAAPAAQPVTPVQTQSTPAFETSANKPLGPSGKR